MLERIVAGSTDRRELVRELDESRTTVYRGLEQLEELDLVVETNGVYAPTTFGRLVFDLFDGLGRTIDTLRDAEELLESVPEGSMDLAPFFF